MTLFRSRDPFPYVGGTVSKFDSVCLRRGKRPYEAVRQYLAGATYLEWDDVEPPIVRVSACLTVISWSRSACIRIFSESLWSSNTNSL